MRVQDVFLELISPEMLRVRRASRPQPASPTTRTAPRRDVSGASILARASS